jgi:hypothetical protein
MKKCKQNRYMNYETNNDFRYNVWKFRVINCDKILIKFNTF